jgi:hypothetical protein
LNIDEREDLQRLRKLWLMDDKLVLMCGQEFQDKKDWWKKGGTGRQLSKRRMSESSGTVDPWVLCHVTLNLIWIANVGSNALNS